MAQIGNKNTASINQDSSTNGFENSDSGSKYNVATVTQKGDWNTATVNQDDNNTATVIQTAMGTEDHQNTVLINQYDDLAIATAEQYGAEGNSITIEQGFGSTGGNGSVNIATAIQTGSFNTATITQQP